MRSKFCPVIPLILLLAGCAGIAKPAADSPGVDLDEAVKKAAREMEAGIPRDTMVALVSVASPSTAFSTQVLTRLESALVSGRKLVVVDRSNLDKVREEQGFQLSGEVDDESAKSIGKLLGAGAIVTGTLADLGDVYSLNLKAINIETATVAVSYLGDLAKTSRIETLLASGGGAGAVSSGGKAAGGGQTQTAVSPAPVQSAPAPVPEGPADGTYTFWPRVQAFQGARAVSVYLDRIVVLRGYMTIYIFATPEGNGGYTESLNGNWRNASLVDMNSSRPARLVQVVPKTGAVYGSVTMCDLTFQNVSGTRLTLASADTPPIEFYDIVLGEPDK